MVILFTRTHHVLRLPERYKDAASIITVTKTTCFRSLIDAQICMGDVDRQTDVFTDLPGNLPIHPKLFSYMFIAEALLAIFK